MRQFLAYSGCRVAGLRSGARRKRMPCATAGNNNAFLGIQTIRLWPGDAPAGQGQGLRRHAHPDHLRAAHGHAQTAPRWWCCPAEPIVGLAGDLEGREVADWFTARGFRAFILSYRLSSHGYLLPVPLLDARRAIQTGAGAGAGLPDRPQSHRGHRLLRRRPPGGALRNAICSPAIPTPRTPSNASPAAPTTWCSATRGSAPSPATPRT